MSGWLSDKGWGGDLASPGPIGNVTPSTGAFTTLSATTSVTSPIVKANGSGGGTLQSNNGTACVQWGAGGGSNVTFDGGASALDNIIISTAGKGINFTGVTPPAGMSSQLLSDYEEGTWTPALAGASTAGVFVYSFQYGRYTKIGQLVIATFLINVNSVTTPAFGPINITGLPFTSLNNAFYRAGGTFANFQNIQVNGTAPMLEVGGNATTATIYGFNNNAGFGASDANSIGASDFMQGTLIYQTN